MALAHLAAGMTLDGFRLEQRLHLGGMAAIWRVTHADIDTPIVLKAPFLDHKGNLSQLVGFEVEQKIMARVTGVHVPRFFANGDFTVQPYVVMEHIAGPTLLQLMAETAMPPDAVLARGLAMAEALADLHGQHVLHLDLKPANVLFRETGEAVIIDFGLSRHAELPDLFHEQYLKPAGTTAYMAPEQLLRIRSDVRSDIFALGAMLYHMATGVRPFGSPGTVERVRRRVWLDPPPPRKLQPGIPPELQEIILKCLEPLPGRRYANADELAFDLRRPELVELTARAGRIGRTGPGDTILRLLHSRTTMREIEASATKPPPRAPIILVSVDLRPGLDAQRAALLDAAVSVLANMPGARLACLDVKLTSLMPEANVDAGRPQHPRRAHGAAARVGGAARNAGGHADMPPRRSAQRRSRRHRVRALQRRRSHRGRGRAGWGHGRRGRRSSGRIDGGDGRRIYGWRTDGRWNRRQRRVVGQARHADHRRSAVLRHRRPRGRVGAIQLIKSDACIALSVPVVLSVVVAVPHAWNERRSTARQMCHFDLGP